MTEPIESLSFVVNGRPIPKGRPRFVRGIAVTPKRTRDYESLVRDVSTLRCGGWRKDGLYRVTITLVTVGGGRFDIDNAAKGILDGMQGAAYDNDVQVSELVVRRQLAMPHGQECAQVLVERIGDRPEKKRRKAAR